MTAAALGGMNWLRVAGLVASGVAVAAYATGVAVEYPGRAFSITLLMVGVALFAITGGER